MLLLPSSFFFFRTAAISWQGCILCQKILGSAGSFLRNNRARSDGNIAPDDERIRAGRVGAHLDRIVLAVSQLRIQIDQKQLEREVAKRTSAFRGHQNKLF